MHESPGDHCVLDTVRDMARDALAKGSEKALWDDLDELLGLIAEPARSEWCDRLSLSVGRVCDDAISAIYWAHQGTIKVESVARASSTR